MGEYADMMLDGTCCAGCGEYLDNGGGDGFPLYCASCQPDFDGDHNDWGFKPKPPKNVQCTRCVKKFATVHAMEQHRSAVHKELTHPCPSENCDRMFSTKGGALDHFEAKHEGE